MQGLVILVQQHNYNVCVGYYSGYNLTTNGYRTGLFMQAEIVLALHTQINAWDTMLKLAVVVVTRHTSIVLGYNTIVGTGYFTFGRVRAIVVFIINLVVMLRGLEYQIKAKKIFKRVAA